jgi:hypothetical protein
MSFTHEDLAKRQAFEERYASRHYNWDMDRGGVGRYVQTMVSKREPYGYDDRYYDFKTNQAWEDFCRAWDLGKTWAIAHER